jgi:phosphoesterase RecJ-like protein
MRKYVTESKAIKVIIDHHFPNTKFTDYEFTDEHASSTGEILYNILSNHGMSPLSKNISIALYTAIMTDTLSFHLATATSTVYRIAANLIDWGADPSNIYYHIYERNDINRFLLLGEILAKAKIIYDDNLFFMQVTQALFSKTGTEEPDIDNFVDYGLKIDRVKIVIFFIELKDGVKISFRSRDNIPINELAKIYGGNGHRNAAGARLYNISLETVIPDVLKNAKKFLK